MWKTCVRQTTVGQRTDPYDYMVKYSHTGLEQVTYDMTNDDVMNFLFIPLITFLVFLLFLLFLLDGF